MKRFLLSAGATHDLAQIAIYLRSLPSRPALNIGKALRETLYTLAVRPLMGRIHERYSEAALEEIRTFPSGQYVIVYAAKRAPVEFLAIIHGKRDMTTLMQSRQ